MTQNKKIKSINSSEIKKYLYIISDTIEHNSNVKYQNIESAINKDNSISLDNVIKKENENFKQRLTEQFINLILKLLTEYIPE